MAAKIKFGPADGMNSPTTAVDNEYLLIQISDIAAKPIPRRLPRADQVTAAAILIFWPHTKRMIKTNMKPITIDMPAKRVIG